MGPLAGETDFTLAQPNRPPVGRGAVGFFPVCFELGDVRGLRDVTVGQKGFQRLKPTCKVVLAAIQRPFMSVRLKVL